MVEELLGRALSSLGALSQSGVLRGALGVALFAATLTASARVPRRIRDHWLFWLAEVVLLPLALLLATGVVRAGLAEAGLPLDEGGTEYGTAVALILVAAYLADRGVRIFLWQGILRERARRIPAILKTVVSSVLYVGAVYAIIAIVYDQPLTGLIVSSGVLLAVLGLALQPILGDVIAGVSLTIDRPFKVGDWIELEDGVRGEVLSTDWRATRILTFHNTVHVVPNGKLSNAAVHNLDEPSAAYGFWFEVPVTKTVPPDLVCRLLLEAAIQAPLVLDEPTPSVKLWDVEDRPISYLVYAHCRHFTEHYEARSQILARAWTLFGKAGFTFSTRALDATVRRGVETVAEAPGPREALGQVALFAPLTDAERQSLVEGGLLREIGAGERIVSQGDAGDSAFVILSGLVRVRIAMGDGRAETEVARLGTFDVMGEMSLLTGAPRSASVTAHTECRLIEIPKVCLSPILERRPALAEELARLMAERKLANEAMTAGSLTRSAADILAEYTEAFARAIRGFFGLKPKAERPRRAKAAEAGASREGGGAG